MFGKKKNSKQVIGQHISGLENIPNVPVLIVLDESGIKLNVVSMKKEYTIALDKITSINYYHETEVEKHLKTSFVGGVIGAATFGVSGAIIGSRPKEKKKHKITFYLLIDYADNQLVFSSEDGFGTGGIVDLFRKIKPSSNDVQSIEL